MGFGSARLPYAVDPPLGRHPRLGQDIGTYGLAQGFEIGGGGLARIDHEIGVQRRHHGPAQLAATPAGLVHQPPGREAGRVLERRAAGLLPDRLGGFTAAGYFSDARADRRRLIGLTGEAGRGPHEPRRRTGGAMSVTPSPAPPRPRPP